MYLEPRLLEMLKQRCLAEKHTFLEIKDASKIGNLPDCVSHQVDLEETPDGLLIHIDNGGDVLGVAHLDTVIPTKLWPRNPLPYKPPYRRRRKKVYSPQLDDRLGVWILLDLLPTLSSIQYDILLTDSEELGQSTAKYFKPDKQYNWIFEFDRAGTDTVLYDYEGEGWIDVCEHYMGDIGIGSFTDICKLEFLGIKGLNMGCGYHRQHTIDCFADLRDTYVQCLRFIRMLENENQTRYEHTPLPKQEYAYPRLDVSYYWERESERAERCEVCLAELSDNWFYCPWCGSKVSLWEHELK